jgi:endo-1,4-beta-xylanase
MKASSTLLLLAALALPMRAQPAPASNPPVPSPPPCDVAIHEEAPPLAPTPLIEAARPHGIAFGSEVSYFRPWPIAEAYKSIVAREFALITPGNEMKWSWVHPRRDAYDFGFADCLLHFADAHGLHVRGHNLVWHDQLPGWLLELKADRDTWEEVLHEHIRTVVGHFRKEFPGRVPQWDVVNEPIADGPCIERHLCTLRPSIWKEHLGDDYVALALRFAREADPDARLYINEVDLEMPGERGDLRRKALLDLVSNLQKSGVPLDGIGFEAHLGITPENAPIPELPQFFAEVAAHGLDIAVTELDVRIDPEPSLSDLKEQAHVYRNVMEACLGQPRCKTFVYWGFSDFGHWLAGQHAAPVDEALKPKVLWTGTLEMLKNHPRLAREGPPTIAAAPQSPTEDEGK